METSLTLSYWSLPVWTKSVHLLSSCYVPGCVLGGANTRMSKTKSDLVGGGKIIIGFIIHPGRMNAMKPSITARGKGWTLHFL